IHNASLMTRCDAASDHSLRGRPMFPYRRPRFARYALFVVGALLTAACAGTPKSAAAPTARSAATAAPAQAAHRNAAFKLVTSFGYTSLDPHRAVNAIADMNWLKPLYDSLLTIEYGTDGLELRPQLAKSFQVSADGRTVSFELRDDVNFQDGTHFN